MKIIELKRIIKECINETQIEQENQKKIDEFLKKTSIIVNRMKEKARIYGFPNKRI